MREQYRKTEPYIAKPKEKPVGTREQLTPELAAQLMVRTPIAHDDPDALCTKVGWDAYQRDAQAHKTFRWWRYG